MPKDFQQLLKDNLLSDREKELLKVFVGLSKGPAALADNTEGTTDGVIEAVSVLANSPALLDDAPSRAEVNDRIQTINDNLAEVISVVNELRQIMKDANLFK